VLSTAQIKQAARDLGFNLVGITTAAPPPHIAAYRQWIADGCHGDMTWMARNPDRRTDLQQILPGARSVIVVGMNYCPSAPTPQIARYAQLPGDYHDTMGQKLAQLAQLVDGLWYVDTGPILERDLAQRAGLGWIGKHTNLLSRQLGNWLLLGEVITRLELEPDPPETGHCGTCTRCIDICPTRAITAPYRLDARRCISYLTIELKGSIPVELRPLIGDHLFGCDDCLMVCPWNRFARPAITARQLPPLTDMLTWTDQQFADHFRGTPIYRLKRARWLRNLCIVLGNQHNPAVACALNDPDPLVREHAQWATAQCL